MSEPVQSETPTAASEGEPVGIARVEAPLRPLPGTMEASPLTGMAATKVATPAQQPPPAPQPQIPPRPRRRPATTTDTPSSVTQAPQQPPPASGVLTPTAAINDPAMASLLTQVMAAQRPAGTEFLLLVLPEDDYPRVEKFPQVEQLVARIKQLLGMPVHVYAFLGNQLRITKGPNSYLQTPYGALPLFDVPDAAEADEVDHGWLGGSLEKLTPPENDPATADEEDPLDGSEGEYPDLSQYADTDGPVF